MVVRETVEITTIMIDRLGKPTKRITEQIQTMQDGVVKSTRSIEKWNKGQWKAQSAVVRTTRGLKHFHFEWLSIMFLGMAINRVFGQYVKGTMEMTGITETFTEALKLTVFTALEPLLDIFYGIIDAIFSLPPFWQKVIGWFIIGMAVIGSLLTVLGALKLGFAGLGMVTGVLGKIVGAFTGLWGVIQGGLAAVGIGIGVFLAILAIIIVVIISIWDAWRTNFMNMKQVVKDLLTGIKMIFKGISDVIVGILRILVGIFTLNWDLIIRGAKQVWEGFKNFFMGLFYGIFNFIAMIGIGIINIFNRIVQAIVGFFRWLYNALVGGSIIPELVNAIIALFWRLPKAIFDILGSMLSGIFSWGVDFVKNIASGIASTGRKVIDAILSLFPSWMRSAIESTGRVTINIIHNITETITQVIKKVFRQHGGLVTAGMPYIVGEAGPEMFVPNATGRIIPNNKLGGGSQIVFAPVYNINIADRHEFENLIKNNNNRIVEDLRRMIEV